MQLPLKIPALTVWQPHAFALAMGWKPVENRGSRLPLKPGDVLAIHAGKTVDKGVDFPENPARSALWDAEDEWDRTGCYPLLLRRSAVLCLVRFNGVHWSGDCSVRDEQGTSRCCTRWSGHGQFHHEVTLLHALAEPVPCSGQRGRWYLPGDVESAVRAQLEAK